MDRTEAPITNSNYENIFLTCPRCSVALTYNRASDLGTFEPIIGNQLVCLTGGCGANLWVSGDTVNEPHEMVVYACIDLFNQKRFMECVTQICQAYEMFFSLHLTAELIYRPLKLTPGSRALTAANERQKRLYNATKRFGFHPMRNLSLRLATRADKDRPVDAAGADGFIAEVEDLADVKPDDDALAQIPNASIRAAFASIAASRINRERNRVAHKMAYRPTRETVEQLFADARSHLLSLAAPMQLYSSPMHY